MTTLISWIGVDHRRPTSIYIAADSRLTAGPEGWNYGRKVFSCNNHPHIFGYCGEVLFPLIVLGQLTAAIDTGALFGNQTDPWVQHRIVVDALKSQRKDYLKSYQLPFWIFHGCRVGSGMSAEFHFWETFCGESGEFFDRQTVLPASSGLISFQGSGAGAFKNWNHAVEKAAAGGTSRAFFQAHCLSIRSNNDPKTGGAPQLAGLHRHGGGKAFAIYWEGAAWLNGLKVRPEDEGMLVDCFNERFERCNSQTGELLAGAQRQPLPAISRSSDTTMSP